MIAWIDPEDTGLGAAGTETRLSSLSIGPQSWGDGFSLAGSAMAGALSDARPAWASHEGRD